MTEDNQGGQDEWAGWQWRRRRDRVLLIARITFTGLALYHLWIVYEAISTGVVLEWSRGIDRKTYSLATDSNAYYFHLTSRCMVLGFFVSATIWIWFYVKKVDHPPE